MIKNIRLALCRVVGQVVNLRPIGGALWARPVLWGSQSWLQLAFSRLSSSRDRRSLPQEKLPKASSIARVNALSSLPEITVRNERVVLSDAETPTRRGNAEKTWNAFSLRSLRLSVSASKS